MNSIKLNNERHNKALKVAEDFKKAGGKITKPANDYKGLTWEAPRPRNQRNLTK